MSTDWTDELSKKYQPSNESWSAQKKHIELKDKILSKGFATSGSFRFESNGETIRVTTFDSIDKLIRLSVFFLPYGESTYVFSEAESTNSDGIRISTKSHCIFSGLNDRKNCEIRLVPLEGNPLTILKIHKKRIRKKIDKLVPMPSDILADFNKSIDAEILAGEKNGILNPKLFWSTEGAFTELGKYYFWKNLFLVKYFPQIWK